MTMLFITAPGQGSCPRYNPYNKVWTTSGCDDDLQLSNEQVIRP